LTFLSLTIVLSILLRFTASKYPFCNFKAFLIGIGGRRGRDRMVVGFTTTYMQSVPFTSKVVSSNPVHGEEYSIQHYGRKFVNDLRQSGGFSPGTPVSFTNKTKLHDVIGIYLKKALNTIALTFFLLVTVLSALCCMTYCWGGYKTRIYSTLKNCQDKLHEHVSAKLFCVVEENCRFINIHPWHDIIFNGFHNKMYRSYHKMLLQQQ
jgi:hypothetical protein